MSAVISPVLQVAPPCTHYFREEWWMLTCCISVYPSHFHKIATVLLPNANNSLLAASSLKATLSRSGKLKDRSQWKVVGGMPCIGNANPGAGHFLPSFGT
mmetsp:Transcript_25852/g.36114  ORF Transcript_25852/g.36114 Transcript_25852/m.36114 type:complete len:100 (+) Transcript_25852:151-450(+)